MSRLTEQEQPSSATERYYSAYPEQDEISLVDIGRVLARQWKWILLLQSQPQSAPLSLF
jgi:hypothetical protein